MHPIRHVLLALIAASSIACGTQPVGTATPPPPTIVQQTPQATASAAPSPAASLDRVAGWTQDIESLVRAMDDIHPHLYHGVSQADLADAVEQLVAEVPTATDDELMVGVLRIVAMVSASGCDGHTGAFVWGQADYPVTSLPLRLWLFDDRVVIVDALAPYEALVGDEILAVDGHPIADVLAALDPIIPRDNAQTVRLLTPRYLLIPEILGGLGLADGTRITLQLGKETAVPADVVVDAIPMADYNAWAGPYGLHLPVDPDVRYLSRIGDALWHELLPDDETLYVQYNRVDRLPASALADLRTALHAPEVQRVILDVRHNFGGEVSALDAIVDLFDDPAVDRPNALFLVTGRNTFSAGSLLVARLQRDTSATIVGEAMGGCPTLWGNPSEVSLRWSGISVSVAGELSVGVDPADQRQTIEPDAQAVLTEEEWADGRDPALEAILGVGP